MIGEMLKALLEAQVAGVLSAASGVSRGAELSLALSETWARQALESARRSRAPGSPESSSRLPVAMRGRYDDYVRELSAIAVTSDLRWLERLDWLRAHRSDGQT